MECPKCTKEMVLKNDALSYDFRVTPNKKYRREIYWCEFDDIWINIEIPSDHE